MSAQRAEPIMLTTAQLARRWGRSVKWVRTNIIKPRAMTIYSLGERNHGVSITDVRVFEKQMKVSAEPLARQRLMNALCGASAARRRDARGRFEVLNGGAPAVRARVVNEKGEEVYYGDAIKGQELVDECPHLRLEVFFEP